ncbi:MAG: hypothetical protein IKI67_05385, partial [Bacteroidales bacterium]|nr:hypothetical protein [Bacteroidales bacterium]
MQEQSKKQINLIDLAYYLLGYWYWFVISIILVLSYTFYKYSKTRQVYRSDAKVIIKDQANTRSGVRMDAFNNVINLVDMSNEILYLKSKMMMSRVVNTLNTDVSYTTKVRLRERELYDQSPIKLSFLRDEESFPSFAAVIVPIDDNTISVVSTSAPFVLNKKVILGDTIFSGKNWIVFTKNPAYSKEMYGKEIHVTKMPLKKAVNSFVARLNVLQDKDNGNILTTSLQDYNIFRANDIISCLVDEYNQNTMDEKMKIAKNTSNFINNRIAIIEEELGAVEDNMAKFRIKERMMNASSTAAGYLGRSDVYNEQIVNIETKIKLADYLKSTVDEAFSKYETIP